MNSAKETHKKGVSHANDLAFYILLLPFGITFFLFMILPLFSSVILSFCRFDTISFPKFIGLENYIRMFLEDEMFPIVLKNTIVFAIVTGPAGFLISFVLAWFLNEFHPYLRSALSFMFYCPALIGNGYFIWQLAFTNDSYGYVNSFLLSNGFITEPVNWLKNATYVPIIIIFVQLWMSMGASFLANIAGLQNINTEMYESAAIDGISNRWQELWYITLPSMKHMLLFSAVMQIASSFSIGAICTVFASYPSVNYCADTIVSYMSDVGSTRFEMGYASALSVVLFALMLFMRKIICWFLAKVGQ